MNEAEKKADEIMKEFEPYSQEYQEGSDMNFCYNLETAKELALIHVNGIIEALERYASLQMLTQWADAIGEWQEVKTIIENK